MTSERARALALRAAAQYFAVADRGGSRSLSDYIENVIIEACAEERQAALTLAADLCDGHDCCGNSRILALRDKEKS